MPPAPAHPRTAQVIAPRPEKRSMGRTRSCARSRGGEAVGPEFIYSPRMLARARPHWKRICSLADFPRPNEEVRNAGSVSRLEEFGYQIGRQAAGLNRGAGGRAIDPQPLFGGFLQSIALLERIDQGCPHRPGNLRLTGGGSVHKLPRGSFACGALAMTSPTATIRSVPAGLQPWTLLFPLISAMIAGL